MSGNYVYDRGLRHNPNTLARSPHHAQPGWDARLLGRSNSVFVPPGSALTHLGAEEPPKTDTDKLIAAAVILFCAFLLWKVITPGVKSNPGGKNKVAKVFKGAGGWYYKLARKRARRYGPFSSHCAASEAAEGKGYSVVE